jgi:uncharacterized protein YcgI (DUF1989 family)
MTKQSSGDAKDKQAAIAALRARYEALRSEGQAFGRFDARVRAAPRIAREIPVQATQLRTSIAPGWYWHGRVPAGTCLRLDNPRGSPGVACLFWNAADTSERFCATDTIKVQWTAALGRGRLLLSDMGRILGSIVEDTCGHHDVLLGMGLPRTSDASSPLVSRNGSENLVLATAKLGLGPRDLHAPITFFAPVRCSSGRRFVWDRDVSLGGTFVDLHVEMDLLAAVSNIPHPMAPSGSVAEEVGLTLWRPEKADIARFCVEATSEAERAHMRTRTYLETPRR